SSPLLSLFGEKRQDLHHGRSLAGSRSSGDHAQAPIQCGRSSTALQIWLRHPRWRKIVFKPLGKPARFNRFGTGILRRTFAFLKEHRPTPRKDLLMFKVASHIESLLGIKNQGG